MKQLLYFHIQRCLNVKGKFIFHIRANYNSRTTINDRGKLIMIGQHSIQPIILIGLISIELL